MGICFAEYLPVWASVLQTGVQRWNYNGFPPAYQPISTFFGINQNKRDLSGTAQLLLGPCQSPLKFLYLHNQFTRFCRFACKPRLEVSILFLQVGALLLRSGVLLLRSGVLLPQVGILLIQIRILLLQIGNLFLQVESLPFLPGDPVFKVRYEYPHRRNF